MIVIKDKDFYINGKAEKLYCGAIHYFRIFKEQWQDRLYKLKCIGFNTVETYCPWNLHAKSGLFPLNDVQAKTFFCSAETDRLHPNADGHMRIAETMAMAMKNIPVFSK